MAESSLQIASSSSRAAALQRQQESAELFRPTSFGEALEFAKVLADSGMVPKAYAGRPAAIIATWQHGLELGVGLMQALQGISNINGNPSVFGDLGWALVQNHPDFVDSIEEVTDTYAVCTLKRRGRTDKTWKYTLDMAKQNDLLGKDNWKKNPKRMLQWRARSWAMRDQFPDSLKGMVIAEEASDYDGRTIDAPPSSPNSSPALTTSVEPELTIGQSGGSDWYKKYKSNGWTPDESKKWLADNLQIGPPHNEKNSKDIPTSKKDAAFAWANTPSPIKLAVNEAFDLLEFKPDERAAFFALHKDFKTVHEALLAEAQKRDAAERGE
jgi:hypothetical protein